ncbi:MAG: glucans biosynthesis glucosyltransferase MdoH [Sphingobium sp.]|uniref:glucans biosynthesis glucosyltransferase MdoH n=1 Tax=Sphingobium sp. TaxID=1912891 RepID=UPI0029BE5ECD|nr:glucans biosynthesis glucosyltransferase MdoH [Sphingobium sp.]MDX3909332.1 glucans biosynthesis glucosyltransferase MdoH [Sphingobium sp.]
MDGASRAFDKRLRASAAVARAADLSVASLPPESPLAMPEQNFSVAPPHSQPAPPIAPGISRVLVLLVLSIATSLLGVGMMTDALQPRGFSAWEVAYLALAIPLFAWIAFGFANSAIGFALIWWRDVHNSRGYQRSTTRVPEGRAAILLPVCNEDFLTIIGRLSIMERSLETLPGCNQFDFFILSDSNAENGKAEEDAYSAVRDAFVRPVYYRRRTQNIGRKPGNVAEWVRRFGGAYEYMIVLDADSVMSGKTMSQLAAQMDREPNVALVQTIPAVVGAQTLFARWQQFASRLYGPMSAIGAIWWSDRQATFWGHNAIIRVKAFAESCGLPELKGPAPFGGHIMSHDMVEAALLRRRGWAVRMVMADDSFEEFPPSLPDLAIRDRRWCQGNIQHIPLIPKIAGLHIVSRFQLLVGASAYVTSPMWLALILTVIGGEFAGAWRANMVLPSGGLLALTLVLLFGPKLMAIALTLRDEERRLAFGGSLRLWIGAIIETALSILAAPIQMLTHSINLISILSGRKSAWNGQTRDCDGIPMADAFRTFRYHVALGVIILIGGLFSGITMMWLMPIVLGLLLAPVLAALTARKDLGRMLEDRGLLAVPKAWWQLSSYRPLRTRLSVGRSTSVWTTPLSVANDA